MPSKPYQSSSNVSETKNRESRALLQFQLREAREEIERLKSSSMVETSQLSNSKTSEQTDLDSAILDYLERKGYQYSAATMIDEVQCESKITV